MKRTSVVGRQSVRDGRKGGLRITLALLLAIGWPLMAHAACTEVAEVSITAPTSGTTVTAPASVTINANVIGPICPGRQVFFLANGNFLFTDSANPWSYTWSNIAPGTYTLTATVQDQAGQSTSQPVTLIVNNPVSVSLTSPGNGTVAQAPASFNLAASASDSTGTITKVEFYANGALIYTDTSAPWGYTYSGAGSGSYSLTAKAYDDHGYTATSNAVSVVSNNLPSVSLTSPANGASGLAPATFTVSANASDSDGSISKVEFYANGGLINTDWAAPYTYDYPGLGSGSYAITAKAYDNYNYATTSGTATVSVNAPPTVSLTSPGNGASGIAPASFTLTASAGDSDGWIGKVEFYANGVLINADSSAPYSYDYTGLGVGNYALTAKAYDNLNAVTTSGTVNVSAVANGAPLVSLTSPSDGATGTAPASFTVSADASDADGSVAKVEFFSNGALFATDTTSPFSVSLNNLGAGTYTLTAKATDNLGLPTTSVARTITVSGVSGVSATRTYVYDAYERLCKTIEPESGATIVDYDGAGNIAWSVQGSNLTSGVCDRGSVPGSTKIIRGYDARNRVLSVLTPGAVADITTTYYPDGAVASVSANNPGVGPVLTQYSYNQRRMLVSESVQESSPSLLLITSYAYNPNGHLSSLTYPDNQVVSYAPNALGQPTQVGSYATGIGYYANGAIAQFTYGNGVVHTMTQNARRLPGRSRDAIGGTVVLDDTYEYDANGNVTDITDQAQGGLTTRGMGYDNLDRLTAAVAPGLWGDAAFYYDGLDNLTRVDQGSRHYRYTYNYSGNRRLAQINDPNGVPQIVLGYDATGNVTSKNSQALVFDVSNRLSQMTGIQTYRYDGLGRRVQTTDADGKYTFWQYSQAGQVLFASEARKSRNTAYIYLGNTQVAARHVAWGSGTVTVDYQHTDALGSPVAETNASGAVTNRINYTPYGEASSTGGAIDGPGYTGHVMDVGTGLTYMQQRYYDPVIGRFLSVDPLAADIGRGFNRYRYAANNPYVFTDPDGREDVSDDKRSLASHDSNLNGAGAINSARDWVGNKLDDAAKNLDRALKALSGDIGSALKDASLKYGWTSPNYGIGSGTIQGGQEGGRLATDLNVGWGVAKGGSGDLVTEWLSTPETAGQPRAWLGGNVKVNASFAFIRLRLTLADSNSVFAFPLGSSAKKGYSERPGFDVDIRPSAAASWSFSGGAFFRIGAVFPTRAELQAKGED